jgi:tRNA threonylcarbamoyladenosine biosynthesis protein TsaE
LEVRSSSTISTSTRTSPDSVTVVEWGHGVAERLADAYLEIELEVVDGEVRRATLTGHGTRWDGVVG